MDRWRKGVEAYEIERGQGAVTFGDDRGLMAEYDVALSPDDIERVRLGYMCISCYEPHETPFPRVCATCGFPMREFQAERFAHTYAGKTRFGPSTTIADEVERMDEEVESARHSQGSRIWLPGDPA